jgi:hypothetical protein
MIVSEMPQASFATPPFQQQMENQGEEPEEAEAQEELSPTSPSNDANDQALHKGTVVRIDGNSRTNANWIGRRAIVKRCVGLGGWYHLGECLGAQKLGR